MTDGTFVEALARITHPPQIMEIDGQRLLFAPPGWTSARAPMDSPTPFGVGSLSALVAYLASGIDSDRGVKPEMMLVNVVSPIKVEVIGALGDASRRFERPTFVVASANPVVPSFEKWLDPEAFVIELDTRFNDSPTRNALRAFVAQIEVKTGAEVVDDGFAQAIAIREGVQLTRAAVPNPVTLAPFRTFSEVDQPESLFLLRARKAQGGAPALALFEADGGAWKREAIARVGRWLEKALEGAGLSGVKVLA